MQLHFTPLDCVKARQMGQQVYDVVAEPDGEKRHPVRDERRLSGPRTVRNITIYALKNMVWFMVFDSFQRLFSRLLGG